LKDDAPRRHPIRFVATGARSAVEAEAEAEAGAEAEAEAGAKV
jgi:hypothetical protein